MTAPPAERKTPGGKQPPAGKQPGRVLPHPAYAMVEKTILERNDDLVRRYGAHHVGVSKKYRKGSRLSDTCITFYVMKKGKNVAAEQIPQNLALSHPGGSRKALIVTDVCEIGGEPEGFNMRGGHLVIASNGQTGTVGLVFRQGGFDLFLTNAHVATDPGLPPGQVSVQVPGGGAFIGNVARIDDLTAPLIRSDAALVAVQAGSVAPGQFHGVDLILENCGDIANNDPRRFFYVAAGFVHVVRWRAFMPAASPIRIDGHVLHYAGFHKFDVTQGQCAPGHSGAVVFCQSQGGLTAVGLLFGGIQSSNEVWVFPVRLCLQQMGVDPDSL